MFGGTSNSNFDSKLMICQRGLKMNTTHIERLRAQSRGKIKPMGGSTGMDLGLDLFS